MLAWVVIVIAALATPISFISLLMILSGGDGSQSAEPLGFLTVVVAPPVSFFAGIALLRRQRWAYLYMLGLLGIFLAFNVYYFLTANPEPQHYISPAGVPTTVLPTDRSMFVPIIAACAGMLAVLLSPRARREFAAAPAGDLAAAPAGNAAASPAPSVAAAAPRLSERDEERRGWRVGHIGRDRMFYEEWRDGAWQRIDIEGEMLTGRAHHVIYFASAERWRSYPEWARQRRDEIVARVTSEFREPDYEYDFEHGSALPANVSRQAAGHVAPARSGQLWAQILVVVLLLALAGGMGLLVNNGISTGETVFPSQRASQRRAVLRAEEPAMFWVSIGIYGAIGIGSLGLLLWGIAITRKEK